MVAEVAAAAGPAEAVQCVHAAPAVAAEVVAVAADPGDGVAGAKSHDLAVTQTTSSGLGYGTSPRLGPILCGLFRKYSRLPVAASAY